MYQKGTINMIHTLWSKLYVWGTITLNIEQVWGEGMAAECSSVKIL